MAYTDAFTDTNGTELSAHNSNWVDAGNSNNIEIQSNVATATVASSFHGYYYNQSFNSKHYAQGVCGGGGGSATGPGIRMAAGPDYYYCFHFPTSNVYNGEVDDGSPTDWDGGLTSPTNGSTLRLEVDSSTETTIYYKVNGSTTETYTSKSTLTGGRGGVVAYSENAITPTTIDDWEGGDIGVTELSASASEAVTVADTGIADVSDPQVSTPSQAVTVADSPSVSVQPTATPQVSASEAVSVADTPAVSLPDALKASAAEAVTVADTPAVSLPDALAVSSSDAVTVADSGSAAVTDIEDVNASASEAITVADSPIVSVEQLAEALFVRVTPSANYVQIVTP